MFVDLLYQDVKRPYRKASKDSNYTYYNLFEYKKSLLNYAVKSSKSLRYNDKGKVTLTFDVSNARAQFRFEQNQTEA